jgi:hypothetical protein
MMFHSQPSNKEERKLWIEASNQARTKQGEMQYILDFCSVDDMFEMNNGDDTNEFSLTISNQFLTRWEWST